VGPQQLLGCHSSLIGCCDLCRHNSPVFLELWKLLAANEVVEVVFSSLERHATQLSDNTDDFFSGHPCISFVASLDNKLQELPIMMGGQGALDLGLV
jgi:hypothetical protein